MLYEGIAPICNELNVNNAIAPKVHLDAFILKITVNKSEVGVSEKVSVNVNRVSEKNAEVLEKVLEKAQAAGEHLSENRISILRIMIANPYVTRPEIAKVLGISLKSVGANIAVMRGKYLNRIGPDKGGFWEVIL